MIFLKRLALLIILTLVIFILGIYQGRGNIKPPPENPQEESIKTNDHLARGGTGITPPPGGEVVSLGGVFETLDNLPTLIDQVKTDDSVLDVMEHYARVFKARGLKVSLPKIQGQNAGIISGFDRQTRELYTVVAQRNEDTGKTFAYPSLTRLPYNLEDLKPVLFAPRDLPLPSHTDVISRVSDGNITSMTLRSPKSVGENMSFFSQHMTDLGWQWDNVSKEENEKRRGDIHFLFFQKSKRSCQITIIGDENNKGSIMMVHMK